MEDCETRRKETTKGRDIVNSSLADPQAADDAAHNSTQLITIFQTLNQAVTVGMTSV
jgi:hypothetical protein